MRINDFWKTAKKLSPLDIIILMAVENLANNDVGYCFANDETIGVKLDRHKSTINKSIGRLIKKGFLYRLKIEKGSTCIERRLYTIAGFKQYTEDKEVDIIKTLSIKQEDGTHLYINERTMDKKQPKEAPKPKENGKEKKEEKELTPEKIKSIFKEHGHKIDNQTVTNVKSSGANRERIIEVLKWAKDCKQGVGSIVKALKNDWITEVKERKKEQMPNAGSRKTGKSKRETVDQPQNPNLSEADLLKQSIWSMGVPVNKRVELLSRVADLEDVGVIKDILEEYKKYMK